MGPPPFGFFSRPPRPPFGPGFGHDHDHHHHHGPGRGRFRHGGRGGHRGDRSRTRDQENEQGDEQHQGSRSRSPHVETEGFAPGERVEGDESETLRGDTPRDRSSRRRCPGGRGRGFGHHGRGWRRGGFAGFGDASAGQAFNLSNLLAAIQHHPWAQMVQQELANAGINLDGQSTGVARDGQNDNTGVNEEGEQTFTPPVDIFTTETSYVLHVSLPGAKKEDVGVDWDGESGVLNIAGVIYRNGDEDFLNCITQSERKVGMFERSIKLPPPDLASEEKEEIDGENIVAKLEDGVLVLTVPKVEREWTEVKKVDIL